MAALKYNRAFALTNEALHTLCCDRGDIRSRLLRVDNEFFALALEEVPDFDGLRNDFKTLREVVLKLSPRGDEGRIRATISRSRPTTLEGIAEVIWEIYRKFSAFMGGTRS